MNWANVLPYRWARPNITCASKPARSNFSIETKRRRLLLMIDRNSSWEKAIDFLRIRNWSPASFLLGPVLFGVSARVSRIQLWTRDGQFSRSIFSRETRRRDEESSPVWPPGTTSLWSEPARVGSYDMISDLAIPMVLFWNCISLNSIHIPSYSFNSCMRWFLILRNFIFLGDSLVASYCSVLMVLESRLKFNMK